MGMGAFGLVWYSRPESIVPLVFLMSGLAQLSKGSTHQSGCGGKEDHETLQHSGPVEAHIPRIEASQASAPRKRERLKRSRCTSKIDNLQVISLSDIFISPLEDM